MNKSNYALPCVICHPSCYEFALWQNLWIHPWFSIMSFAYCICLCKNFPYFMDNPTLILLNIAKFNAFILKMVHGLLFLLKLQIFDLIVNYNVMKYPILLLKLAILLNLPTINDPSPNWHAMDSIIFLNAFAYLK